MIIRLEEAVSELHSVLTKELWDQLEPETRELCMAIHTKLHHPELSPTNSSVAPEEGE